MKTMNIIPTTIVVALSCLALPLAAHASPPGPAECQSIVGMWDVVYTSDHGPQWETHVQWHSDGLEFEVNGVAPGAMCQGTWKATSGRTVLDYHVGFPFGAVFAGSVRFAEVQIITVSRDGKTYDGTYDNKFYGADGKLVGEDTGSMHGTLLPVELALAH